MNKKDIGTIRREFKEDSKRLWIRKLAKAYARIDSKDKLILGLDLIDFDDLESEDKQLYLNSAKKALSGKPGKNLLEMPVEDLQIKEKLIELSNKEWDEQTIRELLQKVVESLDETGSVFINAFLCEFNTSLKDESEPINFFVICLHEARDSGDHLYFDHLSKSVKRVEKQNVLQHPAVLEALMYPLYDQGGAVVDALLYQCGSAKDVNEKLVRLFGARSVMEAKGQKEAFVEVLDQLSDQPMSLKTLKKLSEQIDYINETADPAMEEPSLDSLDLAQVLESCGVDADRLENLDEIYQQTIGDERLLVNNILPAKKFSIKMDGISISLDKEMLDKISTTTLDHKNVLVIELDHPFEIENIPVSQLEQSRMEQKKEPEGVDEQESEEQVNEAE